MAAVRFRSDYYSLSGIPFRVDIWDSSYSGAVTTFNIISPGADVKFASENRERHSPVTTSECSFTFLVENATHQALITDLAGAAESRFWVALYKNSALQWAGVIMSDTIRYSDQEYPFPFEIRAVDGIATLKDTQYTDAGTRYTGPASMLEHVLNVLNKLPYVASLWGGSDEFLRTSIDWWDTNGPATPGSTDDPWKIYWGLHEAFYKFEKGEARVQSCYSVLNNVMTAWGARIYLVDGVFWCEQIHVRNASAFYARNYSKTGTQLSVDNATGDNEIDQSDNNKIGGLQYEYYPALNRVEVTFNAFNRRNYLAGYTVTDPSPSQGVEIKDNSGSASLHISFGISLFLTNDAYSVSPVNFAALIFKITVKVGTKRVQRTLTVSNYTVNYAPNSTWETDTGTQYVYFAYPVNLPVVGQSSIYTIPFDFITPTLESSGAWLFDIFFDGALDQNGGVIDVADFTSDLEITNPYMEVFSYGQPQQNEDDILYKANNPTSGNTAILEVETYLGDADNPNTVGRLLYGSSAGSLVDTTSWGAGVDTRNKNIGDLLATTILNGQLTPIRKMLGSVRGDFLPWRRWHQTLDNTYWLMLGGSWVTGQDLFDGEWFRLQYGSGGVSVTPVRRRVNLFPTTQLPTTPSTNQGPGITTQATGNVEGLVIRPLANNTANGAITAGAITSISVNTALETDEYQIGELVTIYNPINGVFETVTVTADTTNGGTSISVSGTLSNGYPNGAYIIKKQVVGITTLPGGDLGDILRHDGTEWTDYNGSNDGRPLVYDSTNGWQEEQLGTDGIATSAVTLSKIQDISTQRIIGRNTGGTGVTEQVTILQALDWIGSTQGQILYRGASAWSVLAPGTAGQVLQTNGASANPSWAPAAAGGITGSGVAGRIAYWSGTSAITSDDFPLFWDETNNRLGIGTASPASRIHVLAPSGTNEAVMQLTGAKTTGLTAFLSNTDNTTASANSSLIIQSGGASGGDPILQLSIATVTAWCLGVDNSTGDRFAISANTIPGTNDRLVIDSNGYVGINATPSAWLHVGSSSSGVNGLTVTGAIAGNQIVSIANTNNTSTANTRLTVAVGGTSAGDPTLQLSITGGTQWSVGVDNSDSDKLKIRAQISPSDGSNQGITVTNAATSLVGLNNDAPAVVLDATTNTSSFGLPIGTTAQRPAVNGSIRVNSTAGGLEVRNAGAWNRITSTATPTIAANTAAGTGATASIVIGNDCIHQIQVITGSSGVTTGSFCTVTFGQNFDAGLALLPIFCPANSATSLEITKFYVSTSGNVSYIIACSAAPTVSTTYRLNIITKQ